MHEVFPVLSGLVIGALVQWLDDAKLRGVAVVVLSIVFGVIASYISGELLLSWGYVVFDTAQVLVGAAAAWVFFVWWRQRRVV